LRPTFLLGWTFEPMEENCTGRLSRVNAFEL